MNLDALFGALEQLLTLQHFLHLFLGTCLGLIIGVLPGLGGLAGLSMLLPFIYGMEPSYALAMMIGLLAPTTTSDTFPAVLMGIPGTSASQATVVDGHPMARRGEAARALGAAFTASLIGGVIGAIVLTFAIVFARPLVLQIGFGEQLMLMLLALTLVGMLTGRHLLKGLAACCLGLMIGAVGFAPATGESRLAFGQTYLIDGIPIVIFGLGLYAVPEIYALLNRGGQVAGKTLLERGWLKGVGDAFRHRWLVVRCALLGSTVGALPGLGGSVVDWIAYAHAVQTGKNKERFGTGDVRGVLAPEAANNAKEGGALVPTLLFGIPGSGSMAVLLGGFIMLGIQPGISMVTNNLHLSYLIIWSIAIGNVLCAAMCLALAGQIARITRVPFGLVAPFMVVMITFAAFQATRSWGDLIALMAFGVLGILMKEYGWSRPAVLVGAFLAPRLEASVYQSLQVYGLSFFERTSVLIILALAVISLLATILFRPNVGGVPMPTPPDSWRDRRRQLVVPGILAVGAVVVLADTINLRLLGAIFPVTVASLTLLFVGLVSLRIAFGRSPSWVYSGDEDQRPSMLRAGVLLWIFSLIPITALLGLPLAILAFVAVFLSHWWRLRPALNLFLGAVTMAVIVGIGWTLNLRYPRGLLQRLMDIPWWLGG